MEINVGRETIGEIDNGNEPWKQGVWNRICFVARGGFQYMKKEISTDPTDWKLCTVHCAALKTLKGVSYLVKPITLR